jgi:DNA-binding CsgD family transcriptional regulator
MQVFKGIRLLIILTVWVVSGLESQEMMKIRNFTPEDYHFQAQNWAITQGRDGWMYVANNGGLMVFDGARWVHHFLPDKQTLRTVAADAGGRVYGGGFASFGYWEAGADGGPVYVDLSKNVAAAFLAKEEIWHTLVLKDQVLFQSFSTFYRYDGKSVQVLNPPGAIMFVQPLGDRLFFQVIDRGLFELLPDGSFRFVAGSEVLEKRIVQFMIPDGGSGFWVGTTDDGIWCYDGYGFSPWKNPLNQTFKRFQLNKALRLQDGGVAVGTILNGLYLLDRSGNLLWQVNKSGGLQNNTILSLYEDNRQNLWIGLDRGVDFIDRNTPLRFFRDNSGSIGTLYAAAMFRGSLYIGTNQGVFKRQGGHFNLVDGTQGQVWELGVYRDNLLCGHNRGTFLIEGSRANKIAEVTGGWHTLPYPGRADILVQGTYNGLVIFKLGDGGKWVFSHRVTGFREPLHKIGFDQEGYLWGAHPNKGLYRLRLSLDLTQVTEQRTFTVADGIPSDFKVNLIQMRDTLWIHPEAATCKVVYKNGKVRFERLPESFQGCKVIPGRTGAYFKVYPREVIRVDSHGTTVLSVNLINGYETIIDLSDGTYLMCQENGYARLDDKRASSARVGDLPGPGISAFYAGGRRLAHLSDGIATGIPHNQNDIRLLFAAHHFSDPPSFSWKMDGFAEAWSAYEPIAEKEFINLPPGKYVFRLRAAEGGAERPFHFEIRSPWYGTLWARLLFLLFFIGLIHLLFRWQQQRFDRQRDEMEAQKAEDLKHQRVLAERELIGVELENKSRELSNAALGIVRKNEILLRIKEDIEESRGDTRALSKVLRMIDRHVESEHDWEIFEASFNQVHDDFFKKLMSEFPDLTPGDLRLAAYLKMNLSTKEITPLLNISIRGVENKRYRLRRKLGLTEEANLTEFMMNY